MMTVAIAFITNLLGGIARFIMVNPVIALVLATPLFMIANIIGGVLIADKENTWNPDIFKASIYKYLGIVIMALMIYLGGLLSETVINSVIQVDIEITVVMIIALSSLAFRYASDAIKKLYSIVGYKIKAEEDQ